MSNRYANRCPDCNQFAANDHNCPAVDSSIPSASTGTKWTENEDGAVADYTVKRVVTLDDLIEACEVDLTEWFIERHVINKWEVGAKIKDEHGNVELLAEPLFQVKAWLKPHRGIEDVTRAFMDAALKKVAENAPRLSPPMSQKTVGPLVREEPVLFVPSIYDPHIGALAWGIETGVAYDSVIAARDYMNSVDRLMKPAAFYSVDRSLYVIGNDLLHVDSLGPRGKGGQTTKGTPQDIDSRLGKMADVACECLIYGIDSCLSHTDGPVDVVVIKGNHDSERMYMIGKFVQAHYRHEERIRVDYGPALRKYYSYGVNLIGMTHGLEAKRARDSLPLIMSTEAPREMWAATRFRDWLVGHHHTRFRIKWLDQFEERGIRVHALPGLTTEDYWHYQEGYKHRRSAESHIFSSTGGHCGHYSFNLEEAE